MSYKDILLYVDDGESNAQRIKTAFDLAKVHNARLTGITLSTSVSQAEHAQNAKGAGSASAQSAEKRMADFIAAARAENIEANSKIISGNHSVAAYKLAQSARNFDLVILRQANPENKNKSIVEELAEQVILHSGRPVFFVPYIGAHRIPCKKAMIAWDGTPAVTRAVHSAIPLLVGLEEVTLLIIEGKKKTKKGELLADDLAGHLKNHGINIVVSRRAASTIGVPTTILNEISDHDIDMLVMGGYGTPNLQQKIFGGVTKTLLSIMVVPVFMSH